MNILVAVIILGTVSQVSGQAAPVFDANDGDLKDTFRRGVLEGTPINTVLGQLKAYVPGSPNVVLRYAVNSQTVSVTTNGIVRLTRELDREKASESGNDLQSYFSVSYEFNGETVTTGSTVTLTVKDINDNQPQFLNVPYSAQIPENTTIGSTVFSGVKIFDPDIGYNAEVELTCFENPSDSQTVEACEYFGVTTTQITQGNYTGAVFLKKPLDYETRKGFTMTIQAKDDYQRRGNVSLTNSVNVLLEIQDQQDTPPRFTNTPITVFVIENFPVGMTIDSITAKDGDEGSPRPIKIINKDPAQLFKVGDAVKTAENTWTAPVLVNSAIDREVLQARYQFVVEAVELENGVETNQRTETTITVNIQDLDDNIPQFEFSSYVVNVTEMDSQSSGTTTLPGLTMKVTDPDDASFAGFDVEITNAFPYDNFLVSPQSGVGSALISLTIKNPSLLNYEVVADRIQTVNVRAKDSKDANRSSETMVTINLLDANDNYPEFSSARFSFTTYENTAVGEPIGTVTGTDKDSGNNGRLKYSLSGTGADVFSINSDTGAITLAKPLDFETNPKYELLFIATDQGASPRQTSVPLSIDVLNYNDFGPVFNPPSYRTSIRETDSFLLIPVTVQATDKESGNDITYRIIAGNTNDNAFVLGLRTGILSVNRPINYEETPNKQGFLVLTVEATDADQPPQKSNTTITVSIIDENNHDPKFDPTSYTGGISEIDPAGTFVTTVTATDKDFGSNGEIKYYIWSGGQDNFEINADTGRITVSSRRNLDYDAIKTYNVTIHARDAGGPPRTGTASVVVSISDANNKLPFFPKQVYTTKIQESVPIGSLVDTVTASDLDSTSILQYSIPRLSIVARDSNGVIIQSVFPFDYRDAFTINNNTGEIRTALQLSRDAAATIEFKVHVMDTKADSPSVQTATADVLVTILADESVDPVFAQPWTVLNPNYNFRISEETNITTMITTLIATDPALSANIRNFEEVLDSDVGDYFMVDRVSGAVRINKRLDYEALNSKFLTFAVKAIGSQATATATLTIQVTDINDNSPQFLASNYNFYITEDQRYPSQVGAVYASDKDSGSYADIQYSLTGQGSSDFFMFTTGNKEGLILVADNVVLDHETVPVYNLQVVATDNFNADISAEVKQISTVAATIYVQDVNDNAPIFQSGNYSFFTVESYDVGREIGMVTAVDGDRGLFGEILYTLEALDDPDDANRFGINPDTGAFTSRAALQGLSIRSPLHFKVTARDQGSPPKSGVTYIELNITSGQLDDGLPVWTRPAPGTTINIEEGTRNGTEIYKCLAGAWTRGATIQYSFVSSSDVYMEQLFSIDPITCSIKLELVPDREYRQSYDLIIVAQDTLNATLKSSRQLTINLIDKDDERPSFDNCPDRQYGKPELASVREESPNGTQVYVVKACDRDSNPNYNQVTYRFETNLASNFTHCDPKAGEYFNINPTTGVITVKKVIDREENYPTTRDHFLLCIKADQYYPNLGRKKRATPEYNFTKVTSDQYLFLLVTVLDINDQNPEFTNTKMITTAVLKFPTQDEVIQLSAVDKDSDLYNKIRYTITSAVFQGRNLPIDGAFGVNPETGQIRVGMPAYIAFTGGHFLLSVKAEDALDSTKTVQTQIKIFVSEESSQVRLVGNTNNMLDPTSTANNLLSALSNRGSIDAQQTKIQYHTTLSGETVHAQTDICFVVIKNDRVLDAQEGIAEISSSAYSNIFSQYNVGDPGPCEPPTRKSTYDAYWWVLVAFAIFMFVIVVILIIAVWYFYHSYRQYMTTRKTYLLQE